MCRNARQKFQVCVKNEFKPCKKTNKKPHNVKSSEDQTSLVKTRSSGLIFSQICIAAAFVQSVLAVFYSTARLNTRKCNSRFWVNLWPSWQGAERRFGPDVAAAAWCCKGMSFVGVRACARVCMCAGTRLTCPFPPNWSLSLCCCTVCSRPRFWVFRPRPFSTRSSVMWPGDVAGVTESPAGRRFTKCVA